MLVLGRKKGEEVVITTPDGCKVVVRLHDVRCNKVRLGFIADKTVQIHRAELLHEPREVEGGPD